MCEMTANAISTLCVVKLTDIQMLGIVVTGIRKIVHYA